MEWNLIVMLRVSFTSVDAGNSTKVKTVGSLSSSNFRFVFDG